MNIFNDPDDFLIADAILKEIKRLPNGSVATMESLFELVAPGWEETDADLSGIDAAVRKMCAAQKIRLQTPINFREANTGRAYTVPFVITHKTAPREEPAKEWDQL